MIDGTSTMSLVQSMLSVAQATPLVGPLCVSPVKALVSLAQTITGVAGIILFVPSYIVTFVIGSHYYSRGLASLSRASIYHISFGIFSLLYSLTNFASLGILAYRIIRIRKVVI